MLSLVAVVSSWWFIGGGACSLVALGLLWFKWSSYFREHQKASLSIATLLEAVSIGVTGVSILLPSTGALLFYYLSLLTQENLSTTYPLVVTILFLSMSLLFGLWNAFSFSTEYSGGEAAIWTRDYIVHALFFAAQFVFFVVAVMILLFFFILTPLDVTDLLRH